MSEKEMGRRTFLRILATGAGTLLAPPFRLIPLATAATPESLDDVLDPIRAAYDVPALAAAFVRGSELVGLGAVGVRTVGRTDRVQPTDRFHLGSCTKSMTATLCAFLVEKGSLTWDATIGETFPDLRRAIQRDYHKVTLLQLLSHRSGLPDDRGPDAPLWFRSRSLTGPYPQQRLTLMRLLLGRPPATPPGTRMQYANFGYAIAGAMVERRMGQAWEDLIRRMVFGPLHMATAGVGIPEGREPWGHAGLACKPVPPGPRAGNPLVMGPSGGVHCSMADWARYASLHLRGAQGERGLLLKPASFRQVHLDRHEQGYALGWAVVRRRWAKGTVLVHSGTNGRWYAFVWVAPSRNAALLAATNCGAGAQACDAAIGALIQKYL